MFRTFARRFLPNPLDWMLERLAKKGGRKILLGWNRGLGDIALGLYAIVQRIREKVPAAEVTIVTRQNLVDGFSMLEGVEIRMDSQLKRGEPLRLKEFAQANGLSYDLLIENPSPTDWVQWQRGRVVPKLKWSGSHESLFESFHLPPGKTCVGVQVLAETNYGLWRNWPLDHWQKLFEELEKRKIPVLLFGFGNQPSFTHKNVIDLRGKTSLFELLSIIKNKCFGLVLPDSGISSMTYYLNQSFPIRLVSLWADPNHGILKQKVPSPNPELIHCPLIATGKDLRSVTPEMVLDQLFVNRPLSHCIPISQIQPKPVTRAACILLAGGQGSRLGHVGPKGLFPIAGKTLFQWACEKMPELPLAVMTSPLNHEETVAYFKKNHFFGHEVYFFQQEMEPFLDLEKNAMDLKGPNGNGSVFSSFVKGGLGDLFAQRGIDLITVMNVENPLSHPFDPALITYAREEKADCLVQCIEREVGDQSMGVLVKNQGRLEVIEYTELDPHQDYHYAYSGWMAFDLSFFCKMGDIELPLHWVKKKIAIGAQTVEVWKGEKFIFDALFYAKRARAVCVPRETFFAPLKSNQSVATVERMLREFR